MHSPKTIFLIFLIAILMACKNNQKYPYAIKDFDASLQPYLIEIVSAVDDRTLYKYLKHIKPNVILIEQDDEFKKVTALRLAKEAGHANEESI